MLWQEFWLSVQLAAVTALFLVPCAIGFGRALAFGRFPGRGLLEAAINLPLVVPPTVLGFYLLVALGRHSTVGRWAEEVLGHPLVFHFSGLVIASCIANVPFAVTPIQRALAAIPREILEAGACCGLGPWQRLTQIELPLAWPGIISAVVLVVAHTLGEFGVVLMIGGNIPGQTRTMAVAIYDRLQAFDEAGAARMAGMLLGCSLLLMLVLLGVSRGRVRR